jgi:hypothetical protein
MAKSKKNQKEKVKVKGKEPENQNPSPSGLGVQIPNTTAYVGEPVTTTAASQQAAATVSTEEGVQVQVGQVEQAELTEQVAAQQQQQQEAGRAIHPTLGTVFETNVTKYKGRKTEFLTLPMNLTKQPRYPFKGSGKQKARITLSEDGSRLIVERLQ